MFPSLYDSTRGRNSCAKPKRVAHAAALILAVMITPFLTLNCSAAVVPAGDDGFHRIDLSGAWDLRFDPTDAGEKSGWPSKQWSGSIPAAVPGSFNQQFQDHLWYQGKVWYRTSFNVDRPADPSARMYLHFLGVMLRCKVWVNGRLLGENRLPYLGFTFDATPALRYHSKNELVVMVDNKILAKAIPDKKWRGWWNFGGITRPVYLEQRNRLYSDAVVVTDRTNDDGWTLRLQAATFNQGAALPGTVEYSLTDSAGNAIWSSAGSVVFKPGENKQTIATTIKGIEPWSPDNPVLYRLAIRTESAQGDEHLRTIRVGFRKIEVRGSAIYLNGDPLQIRGMGRHEMFAGAGSSVPSQRTRKDLEEIKATGSNMVRLAHYPQSPEVYDLCDELGLLVWSEIPAWQSSAETLSDPIVFSKYAAPELNAMVKQFRNHPSVIVWSVANEVPSQLPQVAEYIHKAVDYVHALDPTRLVSFASDKREQDASFAFVDLIAVNEYFGWYYGKCTDVGPMLDALAAKFPNKPILVTEFGVEGVPGWQKAPQEAPGRDYSVQHQVEFLQTHLQQIFDPQRRKFVAGGLIWVYADFPDPHRVGGDHPKMASYRNNKGLVTEDRQHKPAYDVVKDFFVKQAAEQSGAALPGALSPAAKQ